MSKSIFKYCPSCGYRLITGKDVRLISCNKCAFHFYLSPAPTVAILLKNINNEYLFVKRKFQPKKGYWDLPGGFLDYRETYEKALKREVREELGITISVFNYIGSATDVYDYKGISYYTIVAVYGGFIEQKIIPADDVETFLFFTEKNIPENKFAFPGLLSLVKKYILTT